MVAEEDETQMFSSRSAKEQRELWTFCSNLAKCEASGYWLRLGHRSSAREKGLVNTLQPRERTHFR